MSRFLLFGILVVGLGGAFYVAAHDDFDDHDDDTSVVLPLAEPVFSDEQQQEYETALEAARAHVARTTPNPSSSAVAPSVPTAVGQAESSPGVAVSFVDDDADGVIAAEEVLLGTDPLRADSDGDGVSDGHERAQARNPLVAGPHDQVLFTYSQLTGAAAHDSAYVVTGARFAALDEHSSLVITGTGPAHMYVTLFVSSTPRVVIARADATGRFRVVLDDPLDDGEHEVFAAFTGSDGYVVRRGASFTFVQSDGVILPGGTSASYDAARASFAGLSWFDATLWYLVVASILTVASFVVVGLQYWFLRFRRRRIQEIP